MHPDMVVALLETAVVALRAVAVHEAEVAHLAVGGVLEHETEAVEGSVTADALNSQTAGRGVDVEVTLVEGGRVGDIADESDANRTDLGIALEPCYYVLNASKRGVCAFLVRDSDRNAVLVCVGHVYDSRIAFERAVVVVRTGGRAVLEAEALALVSCCIGSGLTRLGAVLIAVYHGNYLHSVTARLQTYSVGSHVARILSD